MPDAATPPPHPGSPPTSHAADGAVPPITRTTITPAPGTEPLEAAVEQPPRRSLGSLLRRVRHGDLDTAKEPYPGPSVLRAAMSTMLGLLCLVTVGGAILLLLLWQQDRASGVLSNQIDRTWELFDVLRVIERWVALALIPVAVAWILLAVINVRRATGRRRNPVIAAISLPVGLLGVWMVGEQIVAPADDIAGAAAGFVLQLVFLAVPLLALERVAESAEARHRPLRATFLIAAVHLAHLQFLGSLSTIDATTDHAEWPRLGGYLVIAALLLMLGALAANEAARSIEDGTLNRYQLRHRFGESLLADAER